MKVSICIATHDKPDILDLVLASIFSQDSTDDIEVIVVDDGSRICRTQIMAGMFPRVQYEYIVREHGYRGPSVARNVAYRKARGEIIICQSDDTVHQGNAIAGLVEELQPGRFVIATVHNTDLAGRPVALYGRWPLLTSPEGRYRRPLFFLGALYRTDLYSVGGNDEDFTSPGREDIWFADCLINGAKLMPHFSSSVVGHHIHHERPANLQQLVVPSNTLYRKKIAQANTGKLPWCSSGGPWSLGDAPD